MLRNIHCIGHRAFIFTRPDPKCGSEGDEKENQCGRCRRVLVHWQETEHELLGGFHVPHLSVPLGFQLGNGCLVLAEIHRGRNYADLHIQPLAGSAYGSRMCTGAHANASRRIPEPAVPRTCRWARCRRGKQCIVVLLTSTLGSFCHAVPCSGSIKANKK